MAVRQILAILALPVMVVVAVPAWLLSRTPEGLAAWTKAGPGIWLSRLGGALLFAAGLALFAWCVRLFARIGRGTLAPWDPTRSLVSLGPYRYVRNPMITGVALMLAGQSLFWGSWAIAAWMAGFVLINHGYFLLSEEPGLEKRFGDTYRAYKAAVPRWLPRWGNRRKIDQDKPSQYL